MVTGDQIAAHLVGDYLIQSHWMATEKTKRTVAAAAHAVSYGLPFLFLTQDERALGIIIVTHYLIDRYRLARFVVWLKNGSWRRLLFLETKALGADPIGATGSPPGAPDWLAVWLLIIADNTIHLLINGAALAWAGGR